MLGVCNGLIGAVSNNIMEWYCDERILKSLFYHAQIKKQDATVFKFPSPLTFLIAIDISDTQNGHVMHSLWQLKIFKLITIIW